MKIRQLLSITTVTGLLVVAPLLVEGRPKTSIDSTTQDVGPIRDDIVFSAETPANGLYCLSMSALNSNIYTADPIDSAEWQSRLDNAGWSITNMGEDVAWFADASDRFCFYGEDLGEHLYANANIYKVRAVENGSGITMAQQAGSAPAMVASAGEAFTQKLKFEQDIHHKPALHNNPDDDFWYAGFVAHNIGSYPGNLLDTFATPSAATGVATLQVNLMGGNSTADESHAARIEINGVKVGSASWSDIAPKVLQVDFDSGILQAGADNSFELIIESAGRSIIWLDSFTVSYQRNFIAVDDALQFSGGNNELVTVGGLTSPAVNLLELGDPRQPVRMQALSVETCDGGYCASFTPAAPEVEYLLTGQGVEPVITLDQTASTEEGEYVIVAPESLMQGALALQAHRDSEFTTVIKTLGQIYDEENFGIAHPDAIRSFLERAHSGWSKKPRFVTVLGKSTIDPLDHLGYGTGLVPAHMVNTPSGLYVASVGSFADFDGNGIPEIATGHLPAVDSAEVSDYVTNKLQPYEDLVGSRSDSLLAADDDGAGNPYHSRSDEIATLLATLEGNIDYAYHHTDDSISVAEDALFTSLNAGVSYFNYKGHGSTQGLAAEGLLRASDLTGTSPRLSNAGHTPVLGAFTCYVANGSYPGHDSLVEELLFSDSGVAGALASTGPSDNVQSHWLNKGFVQAGFHADPTSTTIGEAAIEGLHAMQAAGAMEFMLPIYGVFGDPAMKINQGTSN